MVEILFRSSVNSENSDWAERSEYWRNYRPVIRGAPKKYHYREPLILCGHGVKLRVDRGTLLVEDGFTHFPQKIESRRYFPGDPDLPSRIVVLDSDGGISFSALKWLSDQEIAFVQLNWRGEALVVATPSGRLSDRKLLLAQLSVRNTRKAFDISRWLIQEKIAASIETIEEVVPVSLVRSATLKSLNIDLEQISRGSVKAHLSSLFGIEGRAAAAYFRSWHNLPIKWKGLGRKPIPESWKKVGARTMGWRSRLQNARHPVNAMLNYAYAMLASELRIQSAAVGVDTGLGFMHGAARSNTPLINDLVEPLRPLADRQVLGLALSHTFTPGDFAINSWGGCRLNPQLARVVANRIGLVDASDVVADVLKMIKGESRRSVNGHKLPN